MAVQFEEVAQRMLEVGKLKNMSALARVFGITPQALSNHKKRGGMPTDLVVNFALAYGVSIDWLITGEERGNTLAFDTTEEHIAVLQTIKLIRTGGAVSSVFRNVLDLFYEHQIKEELCQKQS